MSRIRHRHMRIIQHDKEFCFIDHEKMILSSFQYWIIEINRGAEIRIRIVIWIWSGRMRSEGSSVYIPLEQGPRILRRPHQRRGWWDMFCRLMKGSLVFWAVRRVNVGGVGKGGVVNVSLSAVKDNMGRWIRWKWKEWHNEIYILLKICSVRFVEDQRARLGLKDSHIINHASIQTRKARQPTEV